MPRLRERLVDCEEIRRHLPRFLRVLANHALRVDVASDFVHAPLGPYQAHVVAQDTDRHRPGFVDPFIALHVPKLNIIDHAGPERLYLLLVPKNDWVLVAEGLLHQIRHGRYVCAHDRDVAVRLGAAVRVLRVEGVFELVGIFEERLPDLVVGELSALQDGILGRCEVRQVHRLALGLRKEFTEFHVVCLDLPLALIVAAHVPTVDPSVKGGAREFRLQDGSVAALRDGGATALGIEPPELCDFVSKCVPKLPNVRPAPANKVRPLDMEVCHER
mmetsp:Transcript_22388/g.55967  ORF Transcript_22388/g.55967 Transcript_22388/m.55967 type:complete len:274 (-) Transcript_22388:1493-2314(-)